MIDRHQLDRDIIEPVLSRLHAASPAARALLLGTAAQESAMGRYIRQLRGGPALGIFQMEPATHDDIWTIARTRPGPSPRRPGSTVCAGGVRRRKR